MRKYSKDFTIGIALAVALRVLVGCSSTASSVLPHVQGGSGVVVDHATVGAAHP
jgi:hypothetical protein